MTIFLKIKYTKWYYNIIEQAKNRLTEGYTENHHIIPKSLGGDNSDDNLVLLTAREHFICHWLLTKMCEKENRSKMICAMHLMIYGSKNHSRYKPIPRVYEYSKKRMSEIKKNKVVTKETRKKLSIALTGRKQSLATRQKRSKLWMGSKNPNFGKEFSMSHRKKLSDAKLNNKNRLNTRHTEITKKKISKKLLGRKLSEETKRKMSKSRLGLKRGPYKKTK